MGHADRASGGTPPGALELRRTDLSPRLSEHVLDSPALGTTSAVRVLSPPPELGAGPFPVMLLLHGSDDDYRSWTDDGRAEALTDELALVVVMPDCGRGGWYSDWYCADGPAGAQQWERYHLGELLAWAELHLPVRRDRGGRSVVGLSMGGFGAMSYAARRPDLFGFSAAFSGAVDILDPHLGVFADAMADMNGGRAGDIWGDPQTHRSRWRGHNPVDLAANLAPVELQLRAGNGLAGGRHGGGPDLIETTLHQTSTTLHRTLTQLGQDHVWDDYGPGAHQFPYWSDALVATLPAVLAAAGRRAPTAEAIARDETLHHLTHDLITVVWGWRVELDQDVPAGVHLELRPSGFCVQGVGQGRIVTPTWFLPGTSVEVRDDQSGECAVVLADGAGSLVFEMDLGDGIDGLFTRSWDEGELSTRVESSSRKAASPPGETSSHDKTSARPAPEAETSAGPEALPAPYVIVIGGGPGGLMAAEVLADNGCRVDVIEKMPSVGRKLLLAGRGGLNLTHSEPLDEFLPRYGAAPALLQRAVEQFGPDSLRTWCEGLGQATFVGSSGRVFPETFRANALLSAWVERLEHLDVQLRVGHRFVDWTDDGRPGAVRIEDAEGVEQRIDADAVIMSVGGASWPKVGSDGTWVSPLRRAGVTVHELRPSNAGVEVRWTPVFVSRFAGTPIKNVAVRCAGETARGELMVTEHGLEGGAVYALSRAIRAELDRAGAAELTVDLRPDLAAEELVGRLERRRPKDSLSTVLTRHGALAPVAVNLMREATNNQLPVESRALADLIRATPVPVRATAPLDRAISTAGGVSFDEVDEHFMLTRRAGTFIAGEMLDWDAPTGGYLLQATFSTAVAAANGALAWMQRPTSSSGPPPNESFPIDD